MAPLQSIFCASTTQPEGDTNKSSLVKKYSSSQVQPWSSRFAKAPPKALRNHLQAHHKKEFADMVKEREEEKKLKVPTE